MDAARDKRRGIYTTLQQRAPRYQLLDAGPGRPTQPIDNGGQAKQAQAVHSEWAGASQRQPGRTRAATQGSRSHAQSHCKAAVPGSSARNVQHIRSSRPKLACEAALGMLRLDAHPLGAPLSYQTPATQWDTTARHGTARAHESINITPAIAAYRTAHMLGGWVGTMMVHRLQLLCSRSCAACPAAARGLRPPLGPQPGWLNTLPYSPYTAPQLSPRRPSRPAAPGAVRVPQLLMLEMGP